MPPEPDKKAPENGTAAELIRWATTLIPGDTPRLDAETLLAAALGVDRMAMLLNSHALVAEGPRAAYLNMIERRIAREPVALILGEREFWSLTLRVTPHTLVPRPDSETLVEAALELFPNGAARVLDLGTGTGALILAALSEWPNAYGVAVDKSLAALRVARENASSHRLQDRLSFVCCDWGRALGEGFDLLFCNPPYVEQNAELAPELEFEPKTALFAGEDGLDCYRELVPQLQWLLAPAGIAIFELGAGQAESVARMAELEGFRSDVRHDLAGIARALVIFRTREGLARA